MRMRWTVALVALGVALAGCTPVQRVAGEHFAVPQDLAWRYIMSCTVDLDSGVTGETGFSIDVDGVASVTTSQTGAAAESFERDAEACLNRYRYDTAGSFSYVSAYERAQLFDWYSTETRPCLAAHGVDAPRIDRTQFFIPDRRVWNPYTGMDDLPFDQLISLYRACPPVPDYLLARHER